MFRARQCGLVRSLRVVPGVDDERADGSLIDVACRPHDAAGPWKGASGFMKRHWEVTLHEVGKSTAFSWCAS